MLHLVRQPWVLAAALLLLTSFAADAVPELHHTDDGCQVEIHCLACRTALVSKTGGGLTAAPTPSLEFAGYTRTLDLAPAAHADAPACPTRGPPVT